MATGIAAWPQHPWRLHGVVSMFELLPALYLQALGQPVAKWQSFDLARDHFCDAWWPYDLLEQVREQWVRSSPRMLRSAVSVLRNPWLAIALWSRSPAAPRNPARTMLSNENLAALRDLSAQMRDRAC
jgi:hypothetical protein